MLKLSTICILILLYMICFIENQSINYEEACTKILYSSKKDCSVAPWEDNKRC